MLRNAAKPKLSLSVPALSISTSSAAPLSAAPRSPRSPMVSATTPLTQAARNAQLNQRGASTLQVPTFAYTNSANSKSILKRDASKAAGAKSLRFNDVPSVQCVSPLPAECYGARVNMSKEERRWRGE